MYRINACIHVCACTFTLIFSYQNNQPQKSGGRPANTKLLLAFVQLPLPSKWDFHWMSTVPIIQQSWSSCDVPYTYDCEPTTGAWSCHVGHWYVLTVPSSGSWHIDQTQIIVQQVEDMRQSVEKMVRIKQALIESMQTGGNNQQHQSD